MMYKIYSSMIDIVCSLRNHILPLAGPALSSWVPFIGVGKYYSRKHSKQGRGKEEIGGTGEILIYINQARSILIPEI
jgi:hypothetical protein